MGASLNNGGEMSRLLTFVRAHAVEVAIGFTVGLLTFVGAHAVEVARWSTWFDGQHAPWFLNSGRAVGFTMGCLFVAGAVESALRGSKLPVGGVAIALGAASAMTVVLMAGPGSTIFPIVLAIGGGLLLSSSLAGGLVGWAIRRTVRSAW